MPANKKSIKKPPVAISHRNETAPLLASDNDCIECVQMFWKSSDLLTGWPDWANFLGIVYMVQFIENDRSSPHFCSTFFQSIDYVFILTKIGFGYISGDFFENSSGHPDCWRQLVRMRKSKTLACPVIVCRSTYFLSKPFLSRKDFFLLLQQIFRWLRVSLMSSPSGFIHDKVGVANRSGSLFLKKKSPTCSVRKNLR
jgi:hypothetical protein